MIPLVPGYLTYAAGYSKNRGKLFLGSLLFVLGFTALFVTYGALFGSLGSSIAANSKTITKFLGILSVDFDKTTLFIFFHFACFIV